LQFILYGIIRALVKQLCLKGAKEGRHLEYWKKLLRETLGKEDAANCFSPNAIYLSQDLEKKTLKKKQCSSGLSGRPKKTYSYFLGESYPGVYLTRREAECMSKFLGEKTVVEAALDLNLSPRTVEFYLKNIKNKLACRTKTELVCKIKETDFAKNYASQFEYED
jgi:DNA-binding CsgD family transcriptional regulator